MEAPCTESQETSLWPFGQPLLAPHSLESSWPEQGLLTRLVPAAVFWAMFSDAIGKEWPPGMSQLAPYCYLLLKIGKNILSTWQYLLLLFFFTSFLFFKKRKVTPVLTIANCIL